MPATNGGSVNAPSSPAPMRLRQRMLQAGGWVASGFVLDKLIAAGQLVILARLLTPADFGLMAASAVVLLALLTLSEVGIEQSLITRREVNDTDLAVAWTLSVGRALVLAVCVLIFADAIASFFRMPELALLLRVHSLALLIQGAQSPALAILLRNLDLGRRVRLDLVRRVIEALATIGLAWWLRSVWALLWGQFIGFTVGCLLSYWMVPCKPRLSLDRVSLAQFVQYGKHFNLAMILIFGVTCGGEFVVGRMLGSESLGIYQIALAIPILIGIRAPFIMNKVTFPAYAMLERDRAGTIRVFALQVGVLGLVLVPVATGLVLMASDIVGLLFGPRWLAATDPFRVLCVYAVFAAFSFVIWSLHCGLSRPELQTRIWTVQFLLYAVTIVPLTAQFGLTGSAFALVLASAAGFLLQVGYTIRLLGPRAWPAITALGGSVLPVVAIGAMLAMLRELPLGAAMSLALAMLVLVFGIGYGLYVWKVEYPRLAGLWRGKVEEALPVR